MASKKIVSNEADHCCDFVLRSISQTLVGKTPIGRQLPVCRQASASLPLLLLPMLVSQLPAVHRGVLFEKQALHVLQTYFSMSLHRVGGKDDGGVDLRGWWWLPPLKSLSNHSTTIAGSGTEASSNSCSRIRVIAQCKAEKKKMGPGYVREMEGVLYRHLHPPTSTGPLPEDNTYDDDVPPAPSDAVMWRHPTVALIVSASPFTKAAVLRTFSSTLPFLLLHLPLSESRDTGAEVALNAATHDVIESQQPGSVFWNSAIASGVLGGELELRWERFGNEAVQNNIHIPGSCASGRPALWWNKEPVQNWAPQEFQSEATKIKTSELYAS